MALTYSAPAAATITLDGLANNSRAISSSIDNSTTLYNQLHVMVTVNPTVLADGGEIAVGVLNSLDGTTFSTMMVAPTVIKQLTANTPHVHFCVVNNLAPHFQIVVRNISGGPLGTGNSLSYVGVNH